MAEDEPPQAPKSPKDARLASLDERLQQMQLKEAAKARGSRQASQTGQTQGMRILSVLFGYPLGSALLGWLADRWFGTHIIVVVMLFVGFGTAMWEVWKISQQRPE